ncbi:RNHCP domain-containing protein [Patescibacteria group bacterium]|nr:RNHCP domain-containing protein [Patescibacteria group bacterium]
MDRKNFIRNKEDFACDSCGQKVVGDGYTNHCPFCLHSKHVDKDVPGDRANNCKGLMAPTGVEYQHGEFYLNHKCLKCSTTKRNVAALEDNFDRIIQLSQNQGV